MRLVLFDIDGTLLHCGRQIRPLFAAAVVEVFGTAGNLDGHDFAGKTDPQILLELLTAVGFERQAVLSGVGRVREGFARRLDRGLDRRAMRLLPGVVELLERLVRRPDLTVGLLTGNWESSGRIKLERFGLNRYFGFGAFGDDGVERTELPPVALVRAERRSGRRFAPHEVVVVGDSLNDVACAKAHGLTALAVATGWTPSEELAAAGADWVVPDLRSAARLLPFLAA